jgi:hypothetical protein
MIMLRPPVDHNYALTILFQGAHVGYHGDITSPVTICTNKLYWIYFPAAATTTGCVGFGSNDVPATNTISTTTLASGTNQYIKQ